MWTPAADKGMFAGFIDLSKSMTEWTERISCLERMGIGGQVAENAESSVHGCELFGLCH